MKNAINWFEIPTTDMDRAVRFYETILDRSLKREIFGGLPMAIFVAEGTGGALVHDPKRRPTADGALVYLDAQGDLDGCLARVARAGGSVALPKTDIGEQGFIAIVKDSEGNLVGLHVPRS